MSRAGSLRDALASEISSAFPTETVMPVVVPHFDREELVGKRVTAVFVSGRAAESSMGVDRRLVDIGIAVASAPSVSSQDTAAARRIEHRLFADEVDSYVEDLISLWCPDGLLKRGIVASHHFETIDQRAVIDSDLWKTKGIYLSAIALTYRDDNED